MWEIIPEPELASILELESELTDLNSKGCYSHKYLGMYKP